MAKAKITEPVENKVAVVVLHVLVNTENLEETMDELLARTDTHPTCVNAVVSTYPVAQKVKRAVEQGEPITHLIGHPFGTYEPNSINQ